MKHRKSIERLLAELWGVLEIIPRMYEATTGSDDDVWALENIAQLNRAAAELSSFALACDAITTLAAQSMAPRAARDRTRH